MKKFIALVLVMMVCGLYACANAEEQTVEPTFGEVVLDVLTWPFNNGFDQIGETFTQTMTTVGEFAEQTWNDTVDWAINLGNDIGNWFSGIFGASEKVEP